MPQLPFTIAAALDPMVGSMAAQVQKRQDIQALRGIAILAVVLYHATGDFWAGGYLGVDLFFVVSGYLITRLIAADIDRGTFTLQSFYVRRVKRLLPAAYVTFCVTAILSALLLTPWEYSAFTKQLLGAVTFSANIILFRQIDYFAGEADIKPLLHTWSLAIEEQFYFILPLVLLWTKKRLRFLVLLSLCGCSLALCFVLASTHPSAAFYFAPTRGWELLVGALCALTPLPPLPNQTSRLLGIFALIVLLFILIAPPDHIHPRWNAVVCTMSTAVLVLYKQPFLTSGHVALLLSALGDCSYSLYLIHWPLLAFSYNIFAGAPTPIATATVLVAAGILAYVQFRFVEEPFRRSSVKSYRVVFSCAALGAAICFLPHWLLANNRPSPNDAAYQRRANVGLSKECDYHGPFVIKQSCVTGPAPTVAVWGDSIAMGLVEGIRATLPPSNSQLLQATRTECGPAIGLVPVPNGRHDPARAAACVAFNESVLRFLTTSPSIEAVVLSASFSRYAQPRDSFYMNGSIEPQTQDLALKSFSDTINQLKTAGKRVFLVAQPPSIDINVGLCLERQMSHLFTRAPEDCNIPRRAYEQMHEPSIRLVRTIGLRTNVITVWPSEVLCHQDICETQNNGRLLYVDRGHLSYAGSDLFGRRARLGALLFP